MLPRLLLLTCAALAALVPDVRAIVYRDDGSLSLSQGLASQPQFSGTGIVVLAQDSGTGTIIAPNWVLTAKHVVTGDGTFTPAANAVTFYFAGGNRTSDAIYSDPNSDMALVHFASVLPTTLATIVPNTFGSILNVANQLIWNVGYGNYANYSSQGSTTSNPGYRLAGTNITSSNTAGTPPQYLGFTNNNTSGTEFESSTAPGDSGGPMFQQTGYRWRVVGEVFGVISTFVDTNTAYDNFITTTTGLTFTPRAAPTGLSWNSTYTNTSANSSGTASAVTDGAGTWNTTRLDFTDKTFTFSYENGTLLPVTFGVNSGAAGTVTLGTPINISNLIFAKTGSGNYTIAGTSTNSLTLQTVGSSITTDVAATISAPMVGMGSSLAKAGAATLTVSGANTYTAGTTINAGTLLLSGAGTLGGTSGALVLNNSGSTLDLGGTSQAVGGFTGDVGTIITNSGSADSTLTVGTGNAGSIPVAFHYIPGGARHQYRTFVSQTGAANVFAGVIQDGTHAVSLAKVGTGTITLSGANTYSGGTTISGGTLALSGSGTVGTGILNFNGASTFDLGGVARTISALGFGTSATAFTSSVTNGSLTVTGASGFNRLNPSGNSGTYALDLSGLTAFTYNQPTQIFVVGGSTGGGNTVDVQLAGGTNNITAGIVQAGAGSSGTFNNALLHLGTTNNINANILQLGAYRVGSSTLDFQSGLTNATAVLRGLTGGVSPLGSLLVNDNLNGSATTGKVDFSGGTVDAIISNVTLSRAATNGSPTATLTMGAGTMNLGTVTFGYSYSVNPTANTTASTFNQNAGTVLANALVFATRTGTLGTGTTPDTLNGTYNLGTSTASAVLSAASISVGTSTDNAASRQVLNFNNGTIQNYDPSLGQANSAGAAGGPMVASDLTISGITGGGAGNNNSTLTINLLGTATHTFNAQAGRSITVANTALITGAGSLTKAGGGTLTLAGSVTHTGATAVSAGAMFVNGTMNGTSGVTVAGGATLGGSGTINTSALNGSVTLAATSKLSPGASGASSAGMLTFTLGTGMLDASAATAANNGAFVFDLGTTASSDAVRLTSGTFNLGVGALGLSDFALTMQNGFGAGTYTLLSSASVISPTVLDPTDLTRMVNGYTEVLSDTGTAIILTVVPEPGTWAMVLLGGMAVIGARRRMRS